MVNRDLLREVVRFIVKDAVALTNLFEKTDASPDEVILSSDDVLFGLENDPHPMHKHHGEVIYTPYRVRKTLPDTKRFRHLLGLDPFKLTSATKYSHVDDVDAAKRLKAEPGASLEVIDTIADRIARKFEDEGVVAVASVDSSQSMSELLGRAVAEKLNVPYKENMVKKTMDPNITWDAAEWAKFQQRVRATGLNGDGGPLEVGGRPATPDEYLAATMKVMERERDQARRLIARGEKPSFVRMMNMKTGHKSLFNLFDQVVAGDLKPGSKVLIVDDNIDSGWTPYHVAARLRAAGLTPLFAAGFKMMRYNDKKGPSGDPGLDKAVAGLEKLADEFADDLFRVGNELIAKVEDEGHGIEADDVYRVIKVGEAGVELSDVDTGNVVRLQKPLTAPKQAHKMWLNIA